MLTDDEFTEQKRRLLHRR
ncbi:hypothetical protein [Dactylosporangium cerinum]